MNDKTASTFISYMANMTIQDSQEQIEDSPFISLLSEEHPRDCRNPRL